MSQALVRLQRRGQMVIPRSLRDEAGVAEGALMKVSVLEGGRFLLTPQVMLDRPVVEKGRKKRKELLRELATAVNELRREAKAKGIDSMPMREIRAAVTAARRDLKKNGKQPAR